MDIVIRILTNMLKGPLGLTTLVAVTLFPNKNRTKNLEYNIMQLE